MASGWLAISPWKRTSPERPGSATATAILALCVSNPTHTALSSSTARLPCPGLGTGPSGATLVQRHDQRRATPIHERDMGSRTYAKEPHAGWGFFVLGRGTRRCPHPPGRRQQV